MGRTKIGGSAFFAELVFAFARRTVRSSIFAAERARLRAEASRTTGFVSEIQIRIAKVAGARTRPAKMLRTKPGGLRGHSGASGEGRGPGREGSAVTTEVFRPFHGRVWFPLVTTGIEVFSFRVAVAHTLGTRNPARSGPLSPLFRTGFTRSAREGVSRECGQPSGVVQAGLPAGRRWVKADLILLRPEMRMMRGKFGDDQISVSVPVKLPQRRRRIRNFVGRDDAVPVGIERGFERGTRRAICRMLVPGAGTRVGGGSVRGSIGRG